MDMNVKTCPLAEATRALTWEEFSSMVGKNVYILDTDESPEDGGWFLVDSLETEEDEREEDDRFVWCAGHGDYYGFPKGGYGDDYLAYRFPPYKGCGKEHCMLWDDKKNQCAIVTIAQKRGE